MFKWMLAAKTVKYYKTKRFLKDHPTNSYLDQEAQKKILKDATCKFWAGAI